MVFRRHGDDAAVGD